MPGDQAISGAHAMPGIADLATANFDAIGIGDPLDGKRSFQ